MYTVVFLVDVLCPSRVRTTDSWCCRLAGSRLHYDAELWGRLSCTVPIELPSGCTWRGVRILCCSRQTKLQEPAACCGGNWALPVGQFLLSPRDTVPVGSTSTEGSVRNAFLPCYARHSAPSDKSSASFRVGLLRGAALLLVVMGFPSSRAALHSRMGTFRMTQRSLFPTTVPPRGLGAIEC